MIDMVVPCPIGLDEKMAGVKNHGLAIGGRVGSASFNDEAQRRVGMSMRGRYFSGKHDLKSHGNRAAPRLQADIAPERIGAYPHHVRRFHEGGINVCPAPELGLHALGIVSELPVSPHVQIAELGIQCIESVPVINRWFAHGCAPLSDHEGPKANFKRRSEDITFVHTSANGFEWELTLVRYGSATARQ